MFNSVRTQRRVRAMLCLGLATGVMTWGNIIFEVSTREFGGKLYWFLSLLLCLWAIGLAVQEIAVTVLWMKLRRAHALRLLEKPDEEEEISPQDCPSEDPHLIF